MNEALALPWSDLQWAGDPLHWARGHLGWAALPLVALLGAWMIARDSRADRDAAIRIANWVWDSKRTADLIAWYRGESERIASECASVVGPETSHPSDYDLDEADLISLEAMQLQTLQAKEIECILLAKPPDPDLARQRQAIQASLERRRWRRANNYRTPGLGWCSSTNSGVAAKSSRAQGRRGTTDSGLKCQPSRTRALELAVSQPVGFYLNQGPIALHIDDRRQESLQWIGHSAIDFKPTEWSMAESRRDGS